MSKCLVGSGMFSDVRAIISVHLQNQVPGVETRTSTMRITAPCGFFMRSVRAHQLMVGRARQPKGWPGFIVDRFSTLVRFTTRIVESAVVNSLLVKGVQL